MNFWEFRKSLWKHEHETSKAFCRELIKLLGKFGFEVTRVKGSHHILKHTDGRMTVIPVHRGELIGPGLFAKISKDTEIDLKRISK